MKCIIGMVRLGDGRLGLSVFVVHLVYCANLSFSICVICMSVVCYIYENELDNLW